MSAAAVAPVGAWSPFRHRFFRTLYTAQFVSNAGTFMQLVGAQWLMGDLGGGALMVSLVQTATSLPVFLLVLPAGALGDIFDRRRLLIGSQAWMLLVAGLLAGLTLADLMTPLLLLGLTVALGAGTALVVPSFQAIIPEVVERREIAQAAALNGVNFNVARAVGPAIGGIVVAAAGPGWVFALNALSFVGTLGVLAAWRRPARARAFGAEHVWSAVAAGARFVRAAPTFRTVLLRGLWFVVPASVLWALIPVVARESLGLGSGGYGLMLASVGAGAILGAVVLPSLRLRLSLNAMVAAASVAFAVSAVVVGVVHVVPAVVAALALGGLAWIAILSSLNGTAQMLLPDWARARGLAYFTLVFQGGQAAGAVLWGTIAAEAGLEWAFLVAAAGVASGVVLGLRRRLVALDLDLTPAGAWSEPDLVLDPAPTSGPVLVTVQWRVRPERAAAFREAMRPVERVRRRTGARRWGLYQDGGDPTRFVEAYTVATWQEHVRQQQRVTVRDVELERRARDLAENGDDPPVQRLFDAYARHLGGGAGDVSRA